VDAGARLERPAAPRRVPEPAPRNAVVIGDDFRARHNIETASVGHRRGVFATTIREAVSRSTVCSHHAARGMEGHESPHRRSRSSGRKPARNRFEVAVRNGGRLAARSRQGHHERESAPTTSRISSPAVRVREGCWRRGADTGSPRCGGPSSSEIQLLALTHRGSRSSLFGVRPGRNPSSCAPKVWRARKGRMAAKRFISATRVAAAGLGGLGWLARSPLPGALHSNRCAAPSSSTQIQPRGGTARTAFPIDVRHHRLDCSPERRAPWPRSASPLRPIQTGVHRAAAAAPLREARKTCPTLVGLSSIRRA